MGGYMTGKSPTGEDYENLGRKHYFEGRIVFPIWTYFMVLEFW
jgi:hypothetical protein